MVFLQHVRESRVRIGTARMAHLALANSELRVGTSFDVAPGPRTIHQIAQVLKLPERKLLELAGLVPVRDQRLKEASVRFTARSEPVEELRPEELEALEEYVKVLAES